MKHAVAIKGFSAYMPPTQVTNDDLSKIVDTSDAWIYARTGIKSRPISTTENTSALCAAAARKLLRQTDTDAAEIDAIIVCTVTPDYLTPSTACIVQGEIGAANAFAFDLNAACSGFVYGLTVAERLLRGDSYKKALVLGGETLSKIVDWTDRGTCVLFADGVGAALLETSERESFLGVDLHADGTKSAAIWGGHLPVVNPYAQNNPHHAGFFMDGRGVFDFVLKCVPKSMDALCVQTGVPLTDVDWFVPHQANARIVEALAKKTGIGLDRFYMNIARCGNTSAGTIPIALAEMQEKGLITPGSGQLVMLVGFGGGLTWGTMLVRI